MTTNMPTEPQVIDQDWLAISTDGFEQQNSARPPAHRAKELIQNSMDAFRGGKGEIHLTFTPFLRMNVSGLHPPASTLILITWRSSVTFDSCVFAFFRSIPLPNSVKPLLIIINPNIIKKIPEILVIPGR